MDNLRKEINRLWKEVEGLKKQQANSFVHGRVSEVKDNMVRLTLEDEGGEPFISDWVRVQEEAGDGVGGYSSYTQKQVGQPMMLISPNGDIGPASMAIDAGHTNDNPTPGNGKAKVQKMGDASITMVSGKITLAVGGNRIEITASEIVTFGKTRLNDGTKAVHRKDDLDTAFDAAVGGADNVFA